MVYQETKAGFHLDYLEEINTIQNCYAVIHGDSDKNFCLNRDILKKHLEILKERNIFLLIENVRKRPDMPNRKFCYLKEIYELIKDLPSKYYGICYDIAHGAINNEPVIEIEKYKDRIKHFHFIDTKIPNDNHLQLFTGNVDLIKYLKIIGKIDYKGILKIERY